MNFVNSVFRLVMREEIGGVNYDAEAKLKFGRRRRTPGEPEHAADARHSEIAPRAELLLRIKERARRNCPAASDGELADLDETEKEARLLALRLRN